MTKKDLTLSTRKVEALTVGSPIFDHDEYAKTARLARLEDIRLIECNYTVKVNAFLEAETSNKIMEQGFSGVISGYSFNQDVGVAAGSYSWRAEVKCGRKKVMSMKAEYMLVYSHLKEAKADYVRLYFQKLARFTSYPYFRAHFAVQSSASGLNIAPLPSLIERVD